MFTLMIVDNEKIITEGIQKSIKWDTYGVSYVVTANSAAEAYEKAMQFQPDIIMTDIRMPGKSGLELINRLQQRLDDVQYIIISAFNEFEYAKTALNLGVLTFLSKPLKKADIIDAVVRAKKVLEVKRERETRNRHLEELYTKNIPIAREYLLQMLISGKGHRNFDYEYIEDLLDYNGSEYGIILFQLEGERKVRKRVLLKLLHLGELIRSHIHLPNGFHIIQGTSGELVLAYAAGENFDDEALRSQLDDLKQKFRDAWNETVSIGIGNRFPTLEQLHRSQEEAVEALRHRLLLGENLVLAYTDVVSEGSIDKSVVLEIDDYVTRLMDVVKTGDTKQSERCIHEISSLFNSSDIPYYYIRQVFGLLLAGIMRYLAETNRTELYSHLCAGDPYTELFRKQTLNELLSWYSGIQAVVTKGINEERKSRIGNKITRAIEYIQKHSHKEISLVTVADEIGLNPSYFSRLFKKETGVQFVDYIRKRKLEDARRLLVGSDKKVYEVSEELGYQSVQYFSSIFKNEYGLTPAQFKSNGPIE